MKKKIFLKKTYFWPIIFLLCLLSVIIFFFSYSKTSSYVNGQNIVKDSPVAPKYPPLNKADYDLRMNALAHISTSTSTSTATSTIKAGTSTSTSTSAIKKVIPAPLWPVKAQYPDDGAILPFKRIIAYYGNFYSKGMGVLGQYPEDQMLSMLQAEVDKWNAADPETPALPALQYIAVTAQGYAGTDKKYRARMPDDQIDKAISLAAKVNGIVILDIQVGQSKLADEIPLLEKYLEMPQVHLAIDPEFAMKPGQVPGAEYIGTFDAADINYASNYLAQLVKQYNLPPKILIVHRFRQYMVTNYKKIETKPEVQIVMDMDGWGGVKGKISVYQQYIHDEPVQFTGIKLFYHNDNIGKSVMMTPEQVLNLNPEPIYIQYQ